MKSIPDASASSDTVYSSSRYDKHIPAECPMAELASVRCWLVWRAVWERGADREKDKPRKVPYYPNGRKRHGELGAPADLAQLTDFATAAAAARRGKFTGVAIAMSALPDGMVGVDLDDCLSPSGEPATPEAKWLLEQAGAMRIYAERSPGLRGLRALVRGSLPPGRASVTCSKLELYKRKRMLTITGLAVTSGGILPAQEVIDHLVEVIDVAREAQRAAKRTKPRVLAGGRPARRRRGVGTALPVWVSEALSQIDPDTDYDTWLKVGLALHHAAPIDGLEVWWSWGSQAKEPDHVAGKRCRRREYESRWSGFGIGGGRSEGEVVTLGTLWHTAIEHGWIPPASRWPISGERREASRGMALAQARERLTGAIDEALGRRGLTLIKAGVGTGKTHMTARGVASGVRKGNTYLIAVHSKEQRDSWHAALVKAGVIAADAHPWVGRSAESHDWRCPAAEEAGEIGERRHYVAASKCLRCKHGLARAAVRAEDEIWRDPDRAAVPQGRGRLSPLDRLHRATHALAQQWGCGEDDARQRARALHEKDPCTYLDQCESALGAAVIICYHGAVTPEMLDGRRGENRPRTLIMDDVGLEPAWVAVSHSDIHHWLARIEEDAGRRGGEHPDLRAVAEALSEAARSIGAGAGDYPQIDPEILARAALAARRIAKREQVEAAESIRWRPDGGVDDLPLRSILDLLGALQDGSAAWGRDPAGAPCILIFPLSVVQRAALEGGRTALVLDATPSDRAVEAVRAARGEVVELPLRQEVTVLPMRGRTRTAAVRDPRRAADDATALLRGLNLGQDEQPVSVIGHRPMVPHLDVQGGLLASYHGAADVRGSNTHRGRDLLVYGAPVPDPETVYRLHCAGAALVGRRPLPRSAFARRARNQEVDLGDGRVQKCEISLPVEEAARDVELEIVARLTVQEIGRARQPETGSRVVVASGYPLRIAAHGVEVEYRPEPRTVGPTGRQAADVARARTQLDAARRGLAEAEAVVARGGRVSRRAIGVAPGTYSRWHRLLGLRPGVRITVDLLRGLVRALEAAGAAWAERLRVDRQTADRMAAGADPWWGGGWDLAAWAAAAESGAAQQVWASRAGPPAG